jgi:thymidylate synthase (FAD)
LKVTLITYTPEPEKIIASAAKLCYSSSNVNELMNGLTEEKVETFIKKLTDLGHQSPLEHCSFTFGIEGVSRSLSHQLVRHRLASYSQKSQRYVKEGQFEYITPKSISDNPNLNMGYDDLMRNIQRFYNALIELNIPAEDARFVLPNACETKLIMTMNIRELLHFFTERCCNRAQWEIRELANKMLDICKDIAPNIFISAGASCVRGKCKEGKMSCGKPVGGR